MILPSRCALFWAWICGIVRDILVLTVCVGGADWARPAFQYSPASRREMIRRSGRFNATPGLALVVLPNSIQAQRNARRRRRRRGHRRANKVVAESTAIDESPPSLASQYTGLVSRHKAGRAVEGACCEAVRPRTPLPVGFARCGWGSGNGCNGCNG